ncbi:hypothetical protein MY4038_008495 [Beauveria bassiana]
MHTTKIPAGKAFDGAAHSAGRMRRWAAPADPAHHPPPYCFPYKAVLQQYVSRTVQHSTAQHSGDARSHIQRCKFSAVAVLAWVK